MPGISQNPGSLGGGSGMSRAGERAREEAKRKQAEKDWNEAKAGFQDSPAEGVQPTETKPKPVLKKPRFETHPLKVGESALVTCDCEAGAKPGAVQFDLYAEDEKHQWQRVHGVSGCEGKVELYPASAAMADKPGKYKIIASHFDAKDVESDGYDAEAAEEFTGVILYSFQRHEYLVLESEDEAMPWVQAAQDTEALSSALYQAYRDPKPEQRLTAIRGIAEKAETLFAGKAQSKGDGLEELLHVAGNWRDGKMRSLIHIAPHQRHGKPVSGYWRKENDATVKKKLDKALKKNKAAPAWKTKLKMKLLASEYTEGQWPLPWSKHSERGADGAPVNWSPEAAMCRFVAGFAGANLEADPVQGKLKIGASGEMAYSFFEGKVGGHWHFPDADGCDLLRLLHDNAWAGKFIQQGKECRLRMVLELTAKAFAGVSVSAAVNVLTLDLSGLKDKDKEGGASAVDSSSGAKVSGFAGVEAGVGAKAKMQWGPDRHCFSDLGEIGYDFSGIYGIAGELRFEISYESGRFYLAGSAMLAAGFGVRKGFRAELDAEQGVRLIGHLLKSIDCHHVAEISATAYRSFRNYAFVWLTKGLTAFESITQNALDEADDFKQWLEDRRSKLEIIKHNLTASTKSRPTNSLMAPEAIGHAIATLMQTWEDTDAQAILWFLHSADGDHKLRWIIRFSSLVEIPPKPNPFHKQRKKEAYEKGKQGLLDFADGIGVTNGQSDPILRGELEMLFTKAGTGEND